MCLKFVINNTRVQQNYYTMKNIEYSIKQILSTINNYKLAHLSCFDIDYNFIYNIIVVNIFRLIRLFT